ncbi:MAG: mechanosensitive ion channel [Nostocaceae cyanobacterium]|nr:mechanosensitive ion channel [Nostocaceae cyanobacterium]
MDILKLILDFLQKEEFRNLEFFLIFLLISLVVGRYTPSLVKFTIQRASPRQVTELYETLIDPISGLFRLAGTLILISFSFEVLKTYQGFYAFFRVFVDISVIVSVAWLVSRLFRQLIRSYGITLIRRLGYAADDLLLVSETILNVIIGFVAVLAFAKGRFDLVGLLTGLGIGGLAIAFAAQKTLEQLLGTLVLYLDRPFVPGEYIRIPASGQLLEGIFGRVESIGLRSSKIRTAAKSTLIILPNSMLANLGVENITRGKKVMVLLYLDFNKKLEEKEEALVEQVIKESTDSLFGIDPGSTNIALKTNSDSKTSRARVTFFILGSSDNSIELRKRLLELANEKVSKQLQSFGIEFVMQEPNIYVESPVTM